VALVALLLVWGRHPGPFGLTIAALLLACVITLAVVCLVLSVRP
jgi:hypothetical protein